MKAIWNDTIIAESNNTKVVEDNHYFPPDSLNSNYFHLSDTHTNCPWKGKASYFNITVDDETNEDAAWYYHHPKKEAAEIKDYVAFWNGVKVTE